MSFKASHIKSAYRFADSPSGIRPLWSAYGIYPPQRLFRMMTHLSKE
jgi:hypothetical protein